MMKKFGIRLPEKSKDPKGIYKKAIVEYIIDEYPELTVAGIDSPFRFDNIEYAGPGTTITFGSSSTHDVSWIKRDEYLIEKGVDVVWSAENSINEILLEIELYSAIKTGRCPFARKKETFNIAGKKVEVYDNFIRVGNVIIPRKK